MDEAVQEQVKRKLESQVEPMEDGIQITEEQCRTLLDGGQGKDVVLPECAPKNGVEQLSNGATIRGRRGPRQRQRRQRVQQRQQQQMAMDEASEDSDAELPALAFRCELSSESEGVSDGESLGAERGDTEAATNTSQWPGLNPPRINGQIPVNGSNKRQLKRQNKARRIDKQLNQTGATYWSTHQGTFKAPRQRESLEKWRGDMCPRGLALHHPAAGKLLQYAIKGCPSKTGKPWTVVEMQEAIDRGPHKSALVPEAIDQLAGEIEEKVRNGQCKVVEWDSIKDNPPKHLKISPLAMVPHKSKPFRAILDLSWTLRLKNGGTLRSVNDSTTLEAPAGAIDQLGHSLQRIIHAFAEAGEDEVVFMAKYDIKDGFWRMQCQEGEEWNFAYVLPQHEGEPVRLVVPASLQMGWVESPAFFCTGSETARDVAVDYVETAVGSLPDHKFQEYAMAGEEAQKLPASIDNESGFKYLVEVYVDDFISLAIPTSQQQLIHVAQGLMLGVHDVFPADDNDSNDPISKKKLKKAKVCGMSTKRFWALILMERTKP